MRLTPHTPNSNEFCILLLVAFQIQPFHFNAEKNVAKEKLLSCTQPPPLDRVLHWTPATLKVDSLTCTTLLYQHNTYHVSLLQILMTMPGQGGVLPHAAMKHAAQRTRITAYQQFVHGVSARHLLLLHNVEVANPHTHTILEGSNFWH